MPIDAKLTVAEAAEISDVVRRSGGEAEKRLCAKCDWEHMGRTAVIIEWGDPRDWPPLKK